MSPIENELTVSLLALYEKWKVIRYSNSHFKRMLTPQDDIISKGPVGTVQHLLGKDLGEKSGFEKLKRAGKLSWTVEYLLQDSRWHSLFEPWEIERARERIRTAKSN